MDEEQKEIPLDEKVDSKSETDDSAVIGITSTELKSITETISKTDYKQTTTAFGKRIAYKNIIRELTPEELNQTGTQKLIVEDVNRLSEENEDLIEYQNKYFELHSNYCRLDEKFKKNTILDNICNALYGLGGIITGVSFYFFGKEDKLSGIISFLVGIALILVPILAKKKTK